MLWYKKAPLIKKINGDIYDWDGERLKLCCMYINVLPC